MVLTVADAPAFAWLRRKEGFTLDFIKKIKEEKLLQMVLIELVECKCTDANLIYRRQVVIR